MTNVRTGHRRRSVALVVAVVLAVVAAVGACGDDDAAAPATTERSTTTTEATTTSTAPPRPTSTTTTIFDPASVEGEIEAAYLRSWEVYADAVYHLELDEAALAEVYAEDGLANVSAEIEDRIAEGRSAWVRVEHDYVIAASSPDLANVVDHIVNHQVLIDPETKEPIEEDPNERQLLNFVMKRLNGRWVVTLVQEVRP